MIFCNLKVLLAQRNISISKMSADTQISRTTLTALCSNKSGGIQFDTLNTICGYLNVLPNEVILFSPYVLEFKFENDSLYIKATNLISNRKFSVEFAIYPDKKYHQIEFSAFADQPQYKELKSILADLPKYYISRVNNEVNNLLADIYEKTDCNFPFNIETDI